MTEFAGSDRSPFRASGLSLSSGDGKVTRRMIYYPTISNVAAQYPMLRHNIHFLWGNTGKWVRFTRRELKILHFNLTLTAGKDQSNEDTGVPSLGLTLFCFLSLERW